MVDGRVAACWLPQLGMAMPACSPSMRGCHRRCFCMPAPVLQQVQGGALQEPELQGWLRSVAGSLVGVL